MKVSLVKIKNVLGIESLEFKPSQTGVTVVLGKNESGKTSVISALQAIMDGGHDATLIRRGAKDAEVVLVFDDGTEARKSISQERSNLSIRNPKMGRLSAPKSFMESVLCLDSFNPVEFLDAEPKRRLEMLLRAVPTNIDPEKVRALAKAGNLSHEEVLSIGPDTHPLDSLDNIEKRFFGERTISNRLAKDKRTASAQLLVSLPAEAPSVEEARKKVWALEKEVIAAEVKLIHAIEDARHAASEKVTQKKSEISQAAEKFREEKQREMTAIQKAANEETDLIRQKIVDLERQFATVKHDADQKIRSLAASIANRQEGIKAETAAFQLSIGEEEQTLVEKVRADLSPAVDAAKGALMVARDGLENSARHQKTKEFIRAAEADAGQHEDRSKELSGLLADVQKLREQVLKEVPIRGLTVQNGQIMVDGIVFDRLADSKRIEIAVAIAKANSGKLKLVVVDGAERLDPQRFEEFKKTVGQNGLQLICTRVSEGAFRVEAEEESAAAT